MENNLDNKFREYFSNNKIQPNADYWELIKAKLSTKAKLKKLIILKYAAILLLPLLGIS